jgi:hypothetical protein
LEGLHMLQGKKPIPTKRERVEGILLAWLYE